VNWRDFRGRFARPRQPEAAPEPELSPMALASLERVAQQPGVRRFLLDQVQRPQAEEPSHSDTVAEPHPFEALLRKAEALTARADALVVHDEDLEALYREGFTEEGIAEIVRTKSSHGLSSLQEAARLLENSTRPEPATTSHRSIHHLDRVAERESERAYEALMTGDYEAWDRVTIPAAIRAVRGG
jgi:hypothetical protein